MNFFLLIPLAFCAINLCLIAYIWGKSGRRPEARAYMLFAGDLALWEFLEVFLWSDLPDATILVLFRISSPLYLLPGLLLLNFVYEVLSKKRDALYFFFAALVAAGIAIASFTKLMFPDRLIRLSWGNMTAQGPLHLSVIFSTMLAPGLWALGLQARAMFSSASPIRRKQMQIILIGFLTAVVISLSTNVIFTYIFGEGRVPHLASSLLGVCSVFIFVSIVRFRFLSPGVEDIATDMFSRVHDGVVIINGDGSVAKMNAAAAGAFGIEQGTEKNLRASDIFPAPYTFTKEFRDIELSIGSGDGERKYLASQSDIGTDSRSGARLVIMKDVTEWMKAEALLRVMEERFSKAFNASPNAMSIVTLREGRFVDVNETLVRLSGYSREEIIGRTVEEMGTFGTRERLAEYVGILLRDGRVANFESDVTAKDGTVLTGLFFSEIITVGGKKMIINSTINITEKKKMEEEMLKASRIESLGVFAGGIAHDFNNILTAIIGNIALARKYLRDEGPGERLLREAEKASLRAKDLTFQLLTFSRGGSPQRKAVSIPRMLTESAEFALSGSRTRCEFSIEENLMNAEVDEGQMRQVIHNIVLNASQAMPGGGIVRISAVNRRVEPGTGQPLAPGDYVVISVEDDGPGIPSGIIGKIFDPFFTTKATGSGLGLSMSFSIMKKHGGHVSVTSVPGAGARFDIYMPATNDAPSAEAVSVGLAFESPLRVLVMDDDPMILSMLERMLESWGHSVETVKDGRVAIDRYREALDRGKRYDILIMDLTIPGGMGGAEAVRLIRDFDPAVRAIVSSGYSNDPVMADYERYGFSGMVVKPYRMDDLHDTIAKIVRGTTK